MNMADVRKLVDRWLDERVEIDGEFNVRGGDGGSEAFKAISASLAKPETESVTNSGEALGDFIEWKKDQADSGFVEPKQFSSAMKQRGFNAEKRDGDWVIPRIKLKED